VFCSDLLDMAPKGGFRAKIHMLGAFDDDQSFNGVIQDPYYVSFISSLRGLDSLVSRDLYTYLTPSTDIPY